mgnify:CR=1 FL=1
MQYLYILETGLGKDKPPVEFSAGNHVFAREYAKKEGGIKLRCLVIDGEAAFYL